MFFRCFDTCQVVCDAYEARKVLHICNQRLFLLHMQWRQYADAFLPACVAVSCLSGCLSVHRSMGTMCTRELVAFMDECAPGDHNVVTYNVWVTIFGRMRFFFLALLGYCVCVCFFLAVYK